MEIHEYIKKALFTLGLSENEIKVYLEILQNPYSDAIFLKNNTKLSKACVYKMIGLLFDKNIIKIKNDHSIATYKAIPVSKIGKKLSSKGRQLERIGIKLQEISPNNDLNEQIEIINYDENRDYYLEIANKAKDFIWCVGSYKAGEIFNGKTLENEFIKYRVKRGVHADAIIFDNYTESAALAKRDKLEKRETKLIFQHNYPLEFTYLFGDTCASFYKDDKDKIKVMKISSPAYAKAKLMQFQNLWQSTQA
jgi:sugar-specific transcriptional regulator TrmB